MWCVLREVTLYLLRVLCFGTHPIIFVTCTMLWDKIIFVTCTMLWDTPNCAPDVCFYQEKRNRVLYIRCPLGEARFADQCAKESLTWRPAESGEANRPIELLWLALTSPRPIRKQHYLFQRYTLAVDQSQSVYMYMMIVCMYVCMYVCVCVYMYVC